MRSFRRGLLLGAAGALAAHCWHLAAAVAYYCSWPAVVLGAVLAGCAAANFARPAPPAAVRYRRAAGHTPLPARLESRPPDSAGQESGEPPDAGWMWPPDGGRAAEWESRYRPPAGQHPFRPRAIRPQDREWEFLRDRPPAAPDNRPAGQDPAWQEFARQYETAEETHRND